MNYYEHHIGDYAEATAHLSFVEDAAYSRLIRKYYSTEKPLPTDVRDVCRLVGARKKSERDAVQKILCEFFSLSDDGWHQERCDEEIAAYRQGEPERAVRKANENGRLRRHREERASLFDQLHAVGEYPAWNIGIGELRSLHARLCGGKPATETDTTPATAPATPATATHSPSPIPQTPDTRHQSQSCVYETRASGNGKPQPAEAVTGNASSRTGTDETEHAEWEATAALYPPGAARADWIGAERAARKLVEDGEATWDALRAGVTRYAALCAATNRLVTNPVKFFTDQDRPWSQAWPLPNQAQPTVKRIRTAADIADELEARAAAGAQA